MSKKYIRPHMIFKLRRLIGILKDCGYDSYAERNEKRSVEDFALDITCISGFRGYEPYNDNLTDIDDKIDLEVAYNIPYFSGFNTDKWGIL